MINVTCDNPKCPTPQEPLDNVSGVQLVVYETRSDGGTGARVAQWYLCATCKNVFAPTPLPKAPVDESVPPV